MPCVNTSLQSVNVFKEPGKEQDTRQSDISTSNFQEFSPNSLKKI